MILLNNKRYNPGKPFTDSQGRQYPGNWYQNASLEERSAVGFTEVPDPPSVDERFYYVNSDGTVVEKAMPICRDVIKNQLASIRWSKETMGIIYNGHVYATDDASRVNYLGALVRAQSDPTFTINWKAKIADEEENTPAFVTLTSNDIITIVSSGSNYIANCFNHELTKISEVDSAINLDELLAIDLMNGWPSRDYSQAE